jgi:hypothetical protein
MLTAVSFAPLYKLLIVAVVDGAPLVVISHTYDVVAATLLILYVTGTLVPMLGQTFVVDATIVDGVAGLTAVK